MPTRKDEPDATEVIRVRISTALKDRCVAVKNTGARACDAESTFFGYLIAVGLAKYEKSILPHEISEDSPVIESRSAASGE